MSAGSFAQVYLLLLAFWFYPRYGPVVRAPGAGSLTAVCIGTPSENRDPGFSTESSDAILLKELKSMIQEHSAHRKSPSSGYVYG